MKVYNQFFPTPVPELSETAGEPNRKPECTRFGQSEMAADTVRLAWLVSSGSLNPRSDVDFCLLLMPVVYPPPHCMGAYSESDVEVLPLPQS